MNKVIFQRWMFIIFAVCAFLNPILDMLPWFKITMLAGTIFYLGMGWYFPMLIDNGDPLGAELAGFIYATVFFSNFMDSAQMPMASYLLWFGYLMALTQMIYMIVKRKSVRRDMLIQSVVLWLVSPVPLFV